MVRQACYITTSRICCVEIIVTLIRLTVAAGLALALSACASKPPEPVVDFAPDYNFSQPKTIGFYAMSGEVNGNNPTELTDFQRDLMTQRRAQHLKPRALSSSPKRLTQICFSVGI